jgi:hypothetical protein
MNIVRFLGNKKVLSILGGISLLTVGMQRAFTPQSLIIYCDPRWAQEFQRAVKKELEESSIRIIGADRIRNNLQETYPFVKEVTIAYDSLYRARITLQGWRPQVCIQSSQLGKKTYILCAKGKILDKQYFSYEALQGVPSVTLEGPDFEKEQKTKEFIDTMVQLTNKHFDTYNILWRSKTEILLFNKEKKITIFADIYSIHEQDRFAYIERIYAQEEGYKNGMKADIRLKDSIVCSPNTNYTKIYE